MKNTLKLVLTSISVTLFMSGAQAEVFACTKIINGTHKAPQIAEVCIMDYLVLLTVDQKRIIFSMLLPPKVEGNTLYFNAAGSGQQRLGFKITFASHAEALKIADTRKAHPAAKLTIVKALVKDKTATLSLGRIVDGTVTFVTAEKFELAQVEL